MQDLSIISNWKLYGNKRSIINKLTCLKNKFIKPSKFHIAVAPPLIYLDAARNCLLNHPYIHLCAQNVDIHLSGAFTGEISASMLKDLNVKYAFIGHSERRIYHKEDDLYIAKKFSLLQETGLTPILCVGENKIEHDSKKTYTICIKQINTIIEKFGIQSFKNLIIAYEPVWAIGTGISATANQAQTIHKHIRDYIAQFDTRIADKVLIQYGGSVNVNNVIQFISQKDIDGVLIGSASLNINNFFTIIKLIETYDKNTKK